MCADVGRVAAGDGAPRRLGMASGRQREHPGGVGFTDAARGRLRRALLAVGAAVGVRRAPVPEGENQLAIICERLARLDREIARLLVADPQPPALCCRLSATSLAYDGVLLDACQALGLVEPGPPPLAGVTRLETEAALSAAGLRW